ncbi:MAG: hypothetical protein MZV64_64590 [Ignavibacteriales bacterium]|nr:hypothetical protein [Ignavibacteriales bacterium]
MSPAKSRKPRLALIGPDSHSRARRSSASSRPGSSPSLRWSFSAPRSRRNTPSSARSAAKAKVVHALAESRPRGPGPRVPGRGRGSRTSATAVWRPRRITSP